MYIDAKKTLADGRKLPTKQCVEYPTMQEMKEVIEHLGYEAAYEEKAYPRNLTQFGRFRVLLKDPQTGEPKVEGIESRRQLLMKLAELIPGLKSRKEGQAAKAWHSRARAARVRGDAMPAAAAAAAVGRPEEEQAAEQRIRAARPRRRRRVRRSPRSRQGARRGCRVRTCSSSSDGAGAWHVAAADDAADPDDAAAGDDGVSD